MIVLTTLFLAFGILVIDLLTPLSSGEWGLYLIPLLISFRARQKSYPYLFLGICTVFTGVVFWQSLPYTGTKAAVSSRVGGVVALWVTAVLLAQRKRTEEALSESEERLRAILNFSPLSIFVKDRAGRYLEFNRQSEISSGLRREKVLGRTDRELLSPEVAENLRATDEKVLKSSQSVQYQLKLDRKGGERINLVIKFPLFDPEGKSHAVCGVAADITDLKKAEKALAFSNQRLGMIAQVTAAVVGAAPLKEEASKLAGQVMTAFGADACIIRSLEGKNLVFLASAGIPEEEIPASLPVALHGFREIVSLRRPVFIPDTRGHTTALPMLNSQAQGERFMSCAAAPLLAQDEVIGILGIYSRAGMRAFSGADLEHLQIVANHIAVAVANDRLYREVRNQKDQLAEQIAERKRAEEALKQSEGRFRAISEQSLMGIYIMQDGKFCYVNPRYAEIYGYTQGEMLLLQPPAFEVAADEDREERMESASERPAGRGRRMHYRTDGRRKDGSIIGVEVHGIETELNGKPTVIGTLQDVTERVRDETALQRTKEQLQILSRRLLEMQEAERRHIARELHDEIGQALTALKINLQALQQSSGGDILAPRMVDSISIVDRTLRQVRALSLNLRPSMLDDLGLCAALRWYADQQGQRAGLNIRFSAPLLEGRLDPTLETTCFRVAQEALTNIVRHAQAHAVLVELHEEEDCLHLMVRDDGIGFDLEQIRGQLSAGTSMGLLGMEERASLMGGRIELKSAPAQGTEVHAWFPMAQSEAAAEQAAVFAVK